MSKPEKNNLSALQNDLYKIAILIGVSLELVIVRKLQGRFLA
jgi:hypothetical protein